MKRPLSVWIPLLLFWVTGCIPYPVYKTLQPEAQLRVVDKENKPLSEASVTLISSFYPYGHEDFRETRYTDSLGVAEFIGKSEWRIELMALHGWREYFWNWCVEKPGYATFVTRLNSENDFDDDAEVKLNPGASTPCPRGPLF
jgi:hypothetical protein